MDHKNSGRSASRIGLDGDGQCKTTPVLSAFVPAVAHLPLRLLGKHDWLNFEPGSGKPAAAFVAAKRSVVEQALRPLGNEVVRKWQHLLSGDISLPALYAISKLAANGPKVLRVGGKQIQALDEVDIPLTVAEYQQPYPAVVVELPAVSFVAPVDGEQPLPPSMFTYPRHLLVYHDSDRNFVVVAAMQDGCLLDLVMCNNDEKIEDKIKRVVSDNAPERGQVELLGMQWAERIALNSMLVLTQYRTRLSHQHPLRVQQLKKDARKIESNPRRALRAEEELANQKELITFEQDVQFHDEEGEPKSRPKGEHLGGSVKPHHRRGHWRRQACGVRWTDHRLLFIKPVLIRADRFVGDEGNTFVTYRM